NTLIENFNADVGLFNDHLVVGQVVGDGKAQVVTVAFGVAVTDEVQTIQESGASGTFALTFNGTQTGPLNYNATASQVKSALVAVGAGTTTNLAVTASHDLSTKVYTYTVTFLGSGAGGTDPPIFSGVSNLLDPNGEPANLLVSISTAAVHPAASVVDEQRIEH